MKALSPREIKISWQLPLQSKRKLFCKCPVVTPPYLHDSNPKSPGWKVAERVDAPTSVLQLSHRAWQDYSPAQPRTHANHPIQRLLRWRWHPSTSCPIDRGEAPPDEICQEALGKGIALTQWLACQTPHQYVLTQLPGSFSEQCIGYTRSMLLGINGHIPAYKGPCRLASLSLCESSSLRLALTHGSAPPAPSLPHDVEIIELHHGGAPALSWTTGWLPWEQRQALGEWLEAFHEMLATTGWFPPHKGRLQLEERSPQHPSRIIQGPHNHNDWPNVERLLQEALEQSDLARATPPQAPFQEVWRWHNAAKSPALSGWKPRPPHPREPGYPPIVASPPPTTHSTPSRPEAAPSQPETATHQSAYASIPPKSRETDLSAIPVALHWRWRQQWQMQGLSGDVLDGILEAGKVPLFEKMLQMNPRHSPQVWGELLVRWPRGLLRQGCPISALNDERMLAIAALHGMGQCHREALRDLLAFAAYFPDRSVRELLHKEMGIAPLSEAKVKAQLPTLLAGPLPRATTWPQRERFWMGRLMQQLRGAVPGKLVRRELYRLFSESPPSALDQCRFPPPAPRRRKKV